MCIFCWNLERQCTLIQLTWYVFFVKKLKAKFGAGNPCYCLQIIRCLSEAFTLSVHGNKLLGKKIFYGTFRIQDDQNLWYATYLYQVHYFAVYRNVLLAFIRLRNGKNAVFCTLFIFSSVELSKSCKSCHLHFLRFICIFCIFCHFFAILL